MSTTIIKLENTGQNKYFNHNSMSSQSPWQCGLHNSKDRDNALFLNESLSDLKIIFPYHNISFPAHRLMMAKTSPYFEHLFYGPIAINNQEWKVKDNEVEPDVFKVVLAHCYEIDLLDESLEMSLQVYKLADCYMIDSLKSQCLDHLQDIISNNNYTDIKQILDWSTKYNFITIENKVFEIWSIKSNLEKCWQSYDLEIHKIISNLLLNLPIEKHKKFLSRCQHLDVLIFEDSWRHPEEILSCEILMSMLENSTCKNDCKRNDSILKGCISAKILNKFTNMKMMSIRPFTNEVPLTLHVQLSLIDELHSQALHECINQWEGDAKMDFLIKLHIQCNKISPGSLANWSSKDVILYLSNVDDQSVEWALATILSVKPHNLYLPRSSLSFNVFKSLIKTVVSAITVLSNIDICSFNIGSEHLEELVELTNSDIDIYELDDDLYEW